MAIRLFAHQLFGLTATTKTSEVCITGPLWGKTTTRSHLPCFHCSSSRGCLNIKMPSYQHMDSHERKDGLTNRYVWKMVFILKRDPVSIRTSVTMVHILNTKQHHQITTKGTSYFFFQFPFSYVFLSPTWDHTTVLNLTHAYICSD